MRWWTTSKTCVELSNNVIIPDAVCEIKQNKSLTVHIPSLLGDFLLYGVVHGGDLRRQWGPSAGSHGPRRDVRPAGRFWWLLGGDEGLPGGNWWLGVTWGDPLRWQRCFGRRGDYCCGGGGGCCWFGDDGEDSLSSHRWSDGGGGSPLIVVREVVVMIRGQFAWSRGINDHLRYGWNNERMKIENKNTST